MMEWGKGAAAVTPAVDDDDEFVGDVRQISSGGLVSTSMVAESVAEVVVVVAAWVICFFWDMRFRMAPVEVVREGSKDQKFPFPNPERGCFTKQSCNERVCRMAF